MATVDDSSVIIHSLLIVLLISVSWVTCDSDEDDFQVVSSAHARSVTHLSAAPSDIHLSRLDPDDDQGTGHLAANATRAESRDDGESPARNIANWIKNSLIGNRWFSRLSNSNNGPGRPESGQPLASEGPYLAYRHPYYVGKFPPVAPPPHPGYGPTQLMANMLPPPDGFPGPHSSDSMLIAPESLKGTGIEYWLRFIEEANQQGAASGGGGGGGNFHQRPPDHRPPRNGPVEVVLKRPNSIRDQLLIQDNVDYDDSPDNDPNGQGQEITQAASVATNEKTTRHFSPRCDRFVESICLEDFEYPEQAIVDEVYKRREVFNLLYSDDSLTSSGPPMVDGIPRDVEESYQYADHMSAPSSASAVSASGSGAPASSSGYICSSEVLYGKPKLARNKDGAWKVIVNAGEFTQTIRMEKCLKPNARCNYIIPTMETRCAQVHSMHRLIVFEKGRGFFIDSFKIPTGCSCHVIRRKGTGNRHQTALIDKMLLKPPRVVDSSPHGGQGGQVNRVVNRVTTVTKHGHSSQSSEPEVNTQLSNTLWSILMGGPVGEDTDNNLDESLQSQLALIKHLKNNHPQLIASPEQVLSHLTGQVHHHQQQQATGGGGPRPGTTTTILNPNGNQAPVVQVIHVPMQSHLPQPVYRPSGHKSQGYGGGQVGMQPGPVFLGAATETFPNYQNNETADYEAVDDGQRRRPGGPEPSPVAHEAAKYDDDEGDDHPGEPDMTERPSNSMVDDQSKFESTRNGDQTTNNGDFSKRMLSKKINFNYHPIFEYIESKRTNATEDSSRKKKNISN